MAAPSSIAWGAAQIDSDDGHSSRIGIYTSVSSATDKSTVTIQVWFWSKYAVTDSVNTLYFNTGGTSATTSKGAVSINTTNSSSAWSTNNQVQIYSTTVSYTRGSSEQTINCAAKLSGIEDVDSKDLTATTSFTIPSAGSQSVYLCSNGYIYARAFNTATTTYIDSTGAMYAPAFTTGSAIYFSSSGVTAVKFVKGTP